MKIEEFSLKGKNDLELSCFKIIPDKDILGVIQVFHGMGEHKNRYHYFAKQMAKNGFAVYAHDHRKHGLSVRSKEEVGIFIKEDTWENVIEDCNIVSETIQKELPNIPVIIMGHSMGSVIARKYISTYASVPKMAIIMGTLPPISMGRAWLPLLLTNIVGFFKRDKRIPFIAKLLNDPLNKNIKDLRTKFDWLTNNPKEVDKYIKDPLCGYAYSKGFYKEFFNTMIDINKTETIVKTKDIPLLFISGKDDPVGDYGEGVLKVKELYSENGYNKSTINLVEGNRHEIINEFKKLDTCKYIVDWINKEL
jgi:alpha-beta hydrolase superfamily lysophospholipase